MDLLTETLEKGIQAKRKGHYDLALEYYEKAREISPLDMRIFGNIFRVYIGLKRYEDALRILLIICSFSRIDRLIEIDLKDPISRKMLIECKERFNLSSILYKKNIFKSVKFEPELVKKAIEKDQLLNDFILRADNQTYYIGHAFIGLNPSITSTHNIPVKEFLNLNNALLGKPTGNDLRDHKSSGLFLCIGFIFAHMNLNKSLSNKTDIVSYYLDKNNKLNFDIGVYRSFLENDNTTVKPETTSIAKSEIEFIDKINKSGSTYTLSALDYLDWGNAMSERKDFKGAISYFSKALEIDPLNSNLYYNRGGAQSDLKDYMAAISDYTKAVEINSDYTNAYFNRGLAKEGLQDITGAIDDYTKVIEIEPNHSLAYMNRGVAKISIHDLTGAISDLTESLKIDPKYAKAYFNRGVAKEVLPDFLGAISDYTKAIEVDSVYVNSYINRGILKIKLQDYLGAIFDFTKAIEINPKYSKAYYDRGTTKYRINDFAGAIFDFTMVIEMEPKNAKAYYYRGRARGIIFDLKAAISDYDKVIEIDPKHEKAYQDREIAKESLLINNDFLNKMESFGDKEILT